MGRLPSRCAAGLARATSPNAPTLQDRPQRILYKFSQPGGTSSRWEAPPEIGGVKPAARARVAWRVTNQYGRAAKTVEALRRGTRLPLEHAEQRLAQLGTAPQV